MKPKTLYISIPKPCHESWDKMDATSRGAFCHSCSKEVIDFSTMTDREVIEYLSKHRTGCGRFRKDQVDTKLTLSEVDNGIFRWKALLLGLLPVLSIKAAQPSLTYYDQKRTDATPTEITVGSVPLQNTKTSLQPDMSIEPETDTTVFLPEVVVEQKELHRLIMGDMAIGVAIEPLPPLKASQHNYIETEYLTRKQERKKWFRRFLRLD